jgi:hypothetical protein
MPPRGNRGNFGGPGGGGGMMQRGGANPRFAGGNKFGGAGGGGGGQVRTCFKLLVLRVRPWFERKIVSGFTKFLWKISNLNIESVAKRGAVYFNGATVYQV